LTQIHNYGAKKQCENYRGINITNLGNLITDWTEKRYKVNEEQSGFTKEQSTVDHIYVARQILEKFNTQQEDIL
jgi:hypothetical protein